MSIIRKKMLSKKEIAAFCEQMAMILHAGISSTEGISIMAEDAATDDAKEILASILSECELGNRLYLALQASEVFPKYVLDMVEIGEQSGRLEEVMRSLTAYYEREENIATGIKNAITYPFIMIGMMLLVVLVLIIKVLPIFNQVFLQLGSEMTGFSKGLMDIGSTISNYSVFFIALIVLILFCYFFFTKTSIGRKNFTLIASNFVLSKNFYDKIAAARFASGMSMTISSGLDTDQSLEMVARLVDNPKMRAKIEYCQKLILEGSSFADALSLANIFSGIYSKMVAIGFKTGSVDEIMDKIAKGYEEEIDVRISNIISILEPTLVIVLSVIVGMILLSVMLPLMGIMSSIG